MIVSLSVTKHSPASIGNAKRCGSINQQFGNFVDVRKRVSNSNQWQTVFVDNAVAVSVVLLTVKMSSNKRVYKVTWVLRHFNPHRATLCVSTVFLSRPGSAIFLLS